MKGAHKPAPTSAVDTRSGYTGGAQALPPPKPAGAAHCSSPKTGAVQTLLQNKHSHISNTFCLSTAQ